MLFPKLAIFEDSTLLLSDYFDDSVIEIQKSNSINNTIALKLGKNLFKTLKPFHPFSSK